VTTVRRMGNPGKARHLCRDVGLRVQAGGNAITVVKLPKYILESQVNKASIFDCFSEHAMFKPSESPFEHTKPSA